jgi:toxin YhaV
VQGTSPFGERNGWTLYAHPAFTERLDVLTQTVGRLAKKEPHSFQAHPQAKLLKRIMDLILVEVPRDPNAREYQLGNTLGSAYRHWRRAKFLSRFRLFFRFSGADKAIIYAWVNDEATLRKAGARSDPYAVFTKRLKEGNPPDDWNALIQEAHGGSS